MAGTANTRGMSRMRNHLLVFFYLLLTGMPVVAHELRPAYLQITELEKDTYDVKWKVPARGDNMRLSLDPVFDESVEPLGDPVEAFTGGAHVLRWQIRRPGGLDGSKVRIAGLNRTFTDALVRIDHLDGRHATFRVTPERPEFTIEAAPGWGSLAAAYLMLGIEHILLGFDHLLFVLGLLLIVDGTRMLVKTITAFTLAHSLSLAIATFRIVEVPEGPLNVCIALSILFLGPEIVRKWRGGDSFTLRHPWVVAFAFGLLHGIGFASGLSVTGLPHASIPLALLWFNLGVEAGQLAFVFVVLLMLRAWKRIDLEWPLAARRAPGFAIGILGAFWTIDRLNAMFFPSLT